MTRTLLPALLIALVALPAAGKPAAPAPAPAPAAPVMATPKPGDQTKALAPLIGSYRFVGQMHADAFGPGSPEMPSKGSQKCSCLPGGFWLACDIVDVAGTGKAAITWMGHMVIGWDTGLEAYRALGTDNFGNSYVQSGKWDGKKLVLDSSEDTVMMGTPIKFRFSFDFSDPKNLKFTDERSVKGGPYVLGEDGVFKRK